jgi:hypothetical protein
MNNFWHKPDNFSSYPLVKYRSAAAHRDGVFSNPGRDLSSPISSRIFSYNLDKGHSGSTTSGWSRVFASHMAETWKRKRKGKRKKTQGKKTKGKSRVLNFVFFFSKKSSNLNKNN